MKLKGVEQLAQSHTGCGWEDWDLNSGHLPPEPSLRSSATPMSLLRQGRQSTWILAGGPTTLNHQAKLTKATSSPLGLYPFLKLTFSSLGFIRRLLYSSSDSDTNPWELLRAQTSARAQAAFLSPLPHCQGSLPKTPCSLQDRWLNRKSAGRIF